MFPITTERGINQGSTDIVQKFGTPMFLWDKAGTLRLRNAALTNSVMQALYYRLLVNNEHCLCERKGCQCSTQALVNQSNQA